VPYLFEREGTSCENLPETHDFLRELRRRVDARFADRMLLAEANQWPEDAIAYFGVGDECHMAFHFPLMPRLFMGLRMEDRFPIVDILRQTPPLPAAAQWAVFLRNHDELTLEMVTDEERDYMYRAYAHDPAMRVNLGIRRRLAPLLHNNRQKIELMHGLLCALPGTPVLYYGDEIGMGDNVYLGDRDGVRTPMQWSADRNGGFSAANPQRLYLPLIIDPEYNYETVNVAAQLDNPESLLWWVRRLVALRRRHPVFGRGSIELLAPDDHRVLAFVRRAEGQQVLVVANLSRYPQYVELDLSAFRGQRPVELFGHTTFPAIGDLPYLLTLGPHAFYWLSLEPAPAEAAAAEHAAPPALAVDGAWTAALRDGRNPLDAVLPRALRSRRWFGAKDRAVSSARVVDVAEIPMPHLWHDGEDVPGAPRDAVLAFVRVEYRDGEPDTYLLPLVFVPGTAGERLLEDHPSAVVARVRPSVGEPGVLVDAHWLPGYARALLQAVHRRRRVRTRHGALVGTPTAAAGEVVAAATAQHVAVQVLHGEQSNTSVLLGDAAVLKTVRRLEPGESPEVEIGRVLMRAGFAHAPALAGSIEYRQGRAQPATVAVVHRFVPHESDAYSWYRDALGRYFEAALSVAADGAAPGDVESLAGGVFPSIDLLGRRVGELHVALASAGSDPGFAGEPFTGLAQRSTYQSMRNTATRTLRSLERALDRLPPECAGDARFVVDHADALLERLRAILGAPGGQRIRVHGDLHLGQVLSTGRDFVILDYEGEPALSVGERRLKRSPLRDVAGMLRSFDYAARASIGDAATRGDVASEERARELLTARAEQWVQWASAAFLDGYAAVVEATSLLPPDPAARRVQLDVHLVEKALYEVAYDLDHRPDWVPIPIGGLASLLRAREPRSELEDVLR
jgi:maltose alpha-D-glucosyltransferase/alpha-amylase